MLPRTSPVCCCRWTVGCSLADHPSSSSGPVKVVFCLRRRSDLTSDAFHQYWRDVHAPLVRHAIPLFGAIRYVQVRRLEREANRGLRALRGGPEPFDGIAEMWWPDEEAFLGSLRTAEARVVSRGLIADEANFIDLAVSPVCLARDDEIVRLTGGTEQ
jgi:uncharacterized protein (TIGR02118 family)